MVKVDPSGEEVAKLGTGNTPGRFEVFGNGRNFPLSGDVVEWSLQKENYYKPWLCCPTDLEQAQHKHGTTRWRVSRAARLARHGPRRLPEPANR